MLRCIRFALGLVLILSISAGTVHAQGWGWGGWGGWGADASEVTTPRAWATYNMGTGMV